VSSRRELLANFAGQFWVAAMGFAFVPLYLRYLGVEAYGIIGFMATLQAWTSILDLGLTPGITREMGHVVAGERSPAEGRGVFRTFETTIVGLAILAATAIAFVAPWATDHWLRLDALSRADVATALGLIGCLVALRFVIGLYRGTILGLQDAVHFNAATALFATARNGGAVMVIALLTPSLAAFVGFQVVVTIAEATYFAVRIRNRLPTATPVAWFDVAIIRRLWRFSAGVALTAILAIGLTQVDKLLLSTMLPLSDFAAYFLAATLAGALLMVAGPVAATAFPRFSELVARQAHDELRASYHSSCQIVSVLVMPTALVLCCYSMQILVWWTRDAAVAAKAAPVFEILVAGTALNALMQIPYMAQLSHGWVRLGVKANFVGCLVLIPAILFVVPRFGAIGAGLVWLALNAAYVLVVIPLMHLRVMPGECWNWYWRDNLVPAGASALVVLLASTVQSVEADGSALSIMFVAATGVAALLSATLATQLGQGWLFHFAGRN
jgi:O-antigen/teichoic acid export membrane protein